MPRFAGRMPEWPGDSRHRMLPWLCVLLGCGVELEPAPPPECSAAWEAEAARAFVEVLESATRSERSIWGGYALADGAYVVDAGPPDSPEAGGSCLGLWRAGRAIAFTHVDDELSLLTPLYGYYFDADWQGAPDEPYLERAAQPPAIRAWLEGHGVESAVVMPVRVEDFPFELPALVKAQLAIHEGFHVRVQAPRWFASAGAWPVWDLQPDRAGISACYTATDGVAAALESERESLVRLVEALLDGKRANACRAGAEFLERRAERYALLSDVTVALGDSTPGSCRQAEALMELEEGTADYASWTALYDLGLASREELIRRYRATQDELFYLTGALQLHAIQLMDPDDMLAITREINASPGPESGSITAVFGRALDAYCEGSR